MQKIYNLIVVQKNEQLQDKAAPDTTFQAVKTIQDPIEYLLILKKTYFSNQSDHHLNCSLCLTMSQLYNTIQYVRKNTIEYLFRFRNCQKINEA